MNSPHTVETLHRERIDRMTIAERFLLAAALFAWARGFVARPVVAEIGTVPTDRLQWKVAFRQYGAASGSGSTAFGHSPRRLQ